MVAQTNGTANCPLSQELARAAERLLQTEGLSIRCTYQQAGGTAVPCRFVSNIPGRGVILQDEEHGRRSNRPIPYQQVHIEPEAEVELKAIANAMMVERLIAARYTDQPFGRGSGLADSPVFLPAPRRPMP